MKYKIGLVQINNSFSGQNYFPYSIGLLQSYAEKHCSNINEFEFNDIIYKRVSVESAVDRLKNCNIIGFSIYVWNEKISLKIASELKLVNPNCLIIFGGPQVPDKSELFMKTHRFIDIGVHGEGEHIFTLILQNYKTKNWTDIPSISYFEGNELINHKKAGRFKTLDDIPSPYLSGVFDGIIQNNPDEQWLALWETNRGCPFSCTYCDWGSATQVKVSQFNIDRLKKEVDWFSNKKIEFIFCCDANYGILIRDLEITQYIVNSKKTTGYPKILSVQNTKNATERAYQIQKLLSSEGLNKGVTLSVQSMDSTTLKNIKRDNISLESYQELQRRFMKDKIETYSDMILGMPGETYDSFVNGIDQIIENGQHNRIQFNNLSILPNAEMGNIEYQKKFGMESVFSKTINIHGSLNEAETDFVQEIQQLVVSTNSTPRKEWVKTRSYCWLVALLHFDKILQIPLIITNKIGNIPFRTIFESFMDENCVKNYPILNEIRQFFVDKAIDIQNGGEEYCESKEWLNIWWPADEFIFIKLVKENKMDMFYKECNGLLASLLSLHSKPLPENLLQESIEINKSLLKIPFQTEDLVVDISYDIMDFYKSVIENDIKELKTIDIRYKIIRSETFYENWDRWLKEVVWYGNKKGAYLHGNYKTEYQLSGHY